MNTSNTPKSSFAVAALSVDMRLSRHGEVRLLPAGFFKARDGRPHELPQGWFLDTQLAHKLIKRAKLRADDAVIDYEHQTLNSEKNGQPAPAAGWFSPSKLQWRADGLYATDVRWTAPAQMSIAEGEYRYLSPVIEYDAKTGAVLGVAMAALTNYAALDGLDGLNPDRAASMAAVAAAKFDFASLSAQSFSAQSLSAQSLSNHPLNHQESTMDRDQLIAVLGLAADATDKQIHAAINELKAQAQQSSSEAAALKTQMAALKASPTTTPDPAQYAPVAVVEALKADLAALKTAQVHTEVEALVKGALEAGKLLPAQEAWAKDWGGKDVAALKGYLAVTPAIAALKTTQTGGQAPTGNAHNFHADELAVMKQLGVSADDYKKAQEL